MINLESHPLPLPLKNLFLNLESLQFLLRLAKFVVRHSKLVLFPSNVLPRPPLTLILAKITLSDSLKPYLVSLLESLSLLVSRRGRPGSQGNSVETCQYLHHKQADPVQRLRLWLPLRCFGRVRVLLVVDSRWHLLNRATAVYPIPFSTQ